MGMYDYVRVQQPLPDGRDPALVAYQTKDFTCLMDVYIITPDGRLVRENVHWEEVPAAERPDPDLDGLMGALRRVVDGTTDLQFHGDVRFYDFTAEREWHEYVARFTEGQLTRITRVESNEDAP